jgi:hypothetical protein
MKKKTFLLKLTMSLCGILLMYLGMAQNNIHKLVTAVNSTYLPTPGNNNVLATSVTKDDIDPSVTFPPGWSVGSDTCCYGGSYHYSEQVGKTIDITFNGTAIVIYSTRTPNTGSFDVSIDGTPDAMIDTKNQYSVTDYQCPVYQKNNLSEGSHTLRITTKTTARVVLDAIKFGDDIPFVPQHVMMPTLPIGSIKVEGWINKQIQEDMKNGWVTNTGFMDGYPDKPYYYPFIIRNSSRWAGEYPSHWISAAARYGWLTNSSTYRKISTKAVNDILNSLDADGYIGCLPLDQRWVKGSGIFLPMWSYGEGFNALLEYFEYTHDNNVSNAVKKAFDLVEKNVSTLYDGHNYEISCANAATALYKALNDKYYLERAQYWLKRYLKGYTSAPDAGENTLSTHSAGSGIIQSALIDYFMETFDVAAYYNILRSNEYMMNKHIQIQGGPAIGGVYKIESAGYETMCHTNPYAGSESCAQYYWTYLWMRMLSASGETKWADYAEKNLLNAVVTQREKNGVGSTYCSRPNVTALGVGVWGAQEFYAKDHYTACCVSCLPRTFPLLGKYSVLRTEDNGLSVAFYGPNSTTTTIEGSNITIVQNTDYPFSETINMTVSAAPRKSFPLYLRMPAWCNNPSVSVNGTPVTGLVTGQWAVINRTWGSSDKVFISFPAKVELEYWQGNAVAVKRGPLVYTLSLPFGESAWNYCLMLDNANPASSFTFVNKTVPKGSMVWQNSPIALKVKARKINGWTNGNSALPNSPYILSGPVETIELVPIGFSTLRMTYLPFDHVGIARTTPQPTGTTTLSGIATPAFYTHFPVGYLGSTPR